MSSLSPFYAGSDVNCCVKNCCVHDGALSRVCTSCYFLCWNDEDTVLSATCTRFCRSGMETEDPNKQDSHQSLQIAVYVLAVLVVTLTATTIIVMVRWYRCVSRRQMRMQAPVCSCHSESKACLPRIVPDSPRLSSTSLSTEKMNGTVDIDSSRREMCSLRDHPAQHCKLDMDAGSVCETLTDEEFQDVWTPGDTPASSRRVLSPVRIDMDCLGAAHSI